MIRLLTLILSLLISSTLSVSAKISKEDYIKIFTNYNITERIKIQPVINECINRFGKENLKIIKTDKGDVLDHKNEKNFLNCTYSEILNIIKPIPGINSIPKKKLEDLILNNEIMISADGFRGPSKRFVFEENGYTLFQTTGEGVKTDGWRWSKTGQLRVFIDGQKTTWKVSKDYMSLSIKFSSEKKINYFLKYKNKKLAEQRREDERKKLRKKKD